MNDSDLCWMSAADLAAAIAKKKVSPVQVVDAVLSRIDTLKQLNAYVTLDADRARAAAKVGREAASVFTYPFNMTGQPAATVPCGFTKAGLPIGLRIVGRRYDDVTVLRALAAFEAAHPWAQRRPAIG